jgi:hypothetical protein
VADPAVDPGALCRRRGAEQVHDRGHRFRRGDPAQRRADQVRRGVPQDRSDSGARVPHDPSEIEDDGRVDGLVEQHVLECRRLGCALSGVLASAEATHQ